MQKACEQKLIGISIVVSFHILHIHVVFLWLIYVNSVLNNNYYFCHLGIVVGMDFAGGRNESLNGSMNGSLNGKQHQQ